MLEAIVKQHLNKAAVGDPKSVAILYGLLKETPSGTGNKLSELLQEFRAAYDRHANTPQHEEQKAVDGGSSSAPGTAAQGG